MLATNTIRNPSSDNIARFSALLVPCFMLQALAMDIYLPFIPQLETSLGTSYHSVQWTLSIFMIASGIGQPVFGLLVDRYGDKLLLFLSLGLFLISSLSCALSVNANMLIISRFFEGLGACGCMVACLALCRNNLPDESLTRSCTVLNATNGVAPLVAPLIGALLLTLFSSWRSCFFTLSIFSALAITLTRRLKVRSTLSAMPFNAVTVLQRYRKIFTKRPFVHLCLCGATAMAALFLFFSASPILIVKQLHFSEVQFSLLFGLNAVFFIISSVVSTYFQKTFGAYRCLRIGLLTMQTGAITMLTSQLVLGLSIASFIIPNLVITSGVGLVLGTSSGLAMSQFHQNSGMVAAAFGLIVYMLAGVLGFIVTSTVNHQAYAIGIAGTILTLALFCYRCVRRSS